MTTATRAATFGRPDVANERAVPVVLATTQPVQRHGFVEVLDIARADLIRGDLPLIESHDASRVNIGVVREIRIDGDKLRGTAIFGKSARADELLRDVLDQVVTGVSVGYMLTDDGTPITLPDGRAARAFQFQPFEVSIVSVPADTQAGFFRADPLANTAMTDTTTTQPSRNDAAEIAAIAAAFPQGSDLGISAIARGLTVDQFRAEMLRKMASAPVPTSNFNTGTTRSNDAPAAAPGMVLLRSAIDFHNYYGTRGQQPSSTPTFADFLRGAARMKTSEAAQRALSVAVDSSGGYTVPAVHMPSILAALAPASSLLTAGASIVPLDMAGKTFSLAGIDALPTATWRNENDQVEESAPTFRNIVLTPRSLSFYTRVSRELLADGVNIEGALYQAIAQAFATAIDAAGLRGTGTAPQPRGLLHTAGIHSITNGADGAAFGWGNIFDATEKILSADAPMPTAAIMHPRSRLALAKLSATDGQPLQVPPMLAGVQLLTSSQIPTNLTTGTSTDTSEVYIGDFSQMIIGMRENLSIQVLQEHYADYGQVAFMCHARLDFAALYPQAFAIVTGVR